MCVMQPAHFIGRAFQQIVQLGENAGAIVVVLPAHDTPVLRHRRHQFIVGFLLFRIGGNGGQVHAVLDE